MSDKDFGKLIDDEWMKKMREMQERFKQMAQQSSISYQSMYLGKWETSTSETITEFKLDDDGLTPIGYKVLIHVPKKTYWFLSPAFHAIWRDNRFKAHSTPDIYDLNGIHGTKTLDDLEPWWNEYRARIPGIYFNYDIKFVIVKIALWGVVVETEKGFRAEYAKIIEKILEE